MCYFFSKIVKKIPKIMGILNADPKSFIKNSQVFNTAQAIDKTYKMIKHGADIIDIGGEATNPKITNNSRERIISVEEECDRVIDIISAIHKRFHIDISIDTSHPKVMKMAVEKGANMINDQRALTLPGALEEVSKLNVPVCLMHMFGKNNPNKFYHINDYYKMLKEISLYLKMRIKNAIAKGIKKKNIIIDPGLGGGIYGKNTKQNLFILKNLNFFKKNDFPVLVGFSRKSMVCEIIKSSPKNALFGTIALSVIAMQQGAKIIRLHDIKENIHALKMILATNLAGLV